MLQSHPMPLKNEADLLERCARIEGVSFNQLALALNLTIPSNPNQRKGWLGLALEKVLGATAGSKSMPDFSHLGIELKTLPINAKGKPAESTFVTSIPLLTIHHQQWKTSQCYAKLKRVLWIPIEDDKDIPFTQRRVGRGFLWSPSLSQERILAADWNEFVFMISSGYLEKIDASMGDYLQIRPKGSNGRDLCYGFDEAGNKVLTLPRGFYLRSVFTAEIMSPI